MQEPSYPLTSLEARLTVHYRCRCGQEVVLRPREHVYTAFFVLAGLIVVNLVITAFLWWQLSHLPRLHPAEPPIPTHSNPAQLSDPEAPDPGTVQPPADPIELSSSDSKASLVDSRESPSPLSSDDRASDNQGLEVGPSSDSASRRELTSPAIGAAELASGTSSTDSGAAQASSSEDQASANPAVRPVPQSFSLERPAQLHGLWLGILEERELEKEPEEWVAKLGIGRWGRPSSRAQARAWLEESERESWALDWIDSKEAAGFEPAPDAVTPRLTAISDSWEMVWGDLLDPGRVTAAQRVWVEEVAHLNENPTDWVFLVDVSLSMEKELGELIRCVGAFACATEQSTRVRWGWIAYRDESVGAQPLTSDLENFLNSLNRLEASAGGDVTEGVDRALFAALRVGGFDWRPQALHRFVLLGDAPPAYEKIASTRSLLAAAHQGPERFELVAFGIVRDDFADEVPGFRDFAAATEGRAVFARESERLTPQFWKLLLRPQTVIGGDEKFWELLPFSRQLAGPSRTRAGALQD